MVVWPLLGLPAGDAGSDGTAENGEKDEQQARTEGESCNQKDEAFGRLEMLGDLLDRLLQLRVDDLDQFVHHGERRLPKLLPLVREQNLHGGEDAQDEKPEQARNRSEQGP